MRVGARGLTVCPVDFALLWRPGQRTGRRTGSRHEGGGWRRSAVMGMRSLGMGPLAIAILASTASIAHAQTTEAGRKVFESRCGRCHGGDGNGGEMGPAIRERLTTRDDEQLTKLIHEGIPAKGMPPSDLADPDSVAGNTRTTPPPKAAQTMKTKLDRRSPCASW